MTRLAELNHPDAVMIADYQSAPTGLGKAAQILDIGTAAHDVNFSIRDCGMAATGKMQARMVDSGHHRKRLGFFYQASKNGLKLSSEVVMGHLWRKLKA